jgi:SAM-dependent methyltransferase
MVPLLMGELADYVQSGPFPAGPAEVTGMLVKAQRSARYAWAAQFARGRRVLDVGCGVGDGSRVLTEAGAAEVVGIDSPAAMVEVAQESTGANLQFERRDIGPLDHPDDSFEMVVCFAAIDRLADPEVLLAELVRVLRPEGLLAVSWPPHLAVEASLERRLQNVRLLRQENWVGSAVLEDLDGLEVHRSGGGGLPAVVQTVALASSVELPQAAPVAALTSAADAETWLRGWDEQLQQVDEQRQRIEELATMEREREELRIRLIEAEASAERVLQLEAELEQAEWRHGKLQSEVDALSQIVNDVMGSLSWRLTEPLRALKRRLRGSG